MNRFTIFEQHPLQPLLCGVVNLSALNTRWNIDNVSAPYWRLYWNDKPAACILREGRQIPLHPGVLALVPPNLVFSTRNSSRHAIRHLHVHFHLLTPCVTTAREILLLQAEPPFPAMIERLMRLLHEHRHRNWQISFATRALLQWAVSCGGDQILSGPLLDPRVVRVVHYVQEHLKDPLSNDALARHAGMSVNAFRALFRAQTGQSLHAYVRRQRVEKACQLLHASEDSIEHIAEETGFYDRHHFTRVFKGLRGVGPAMFRKINDQMVV